MSQGVVPNAAGVWAKAFRGRGPGELMDLQEGIDGLLGNPAFTFLRTQMIEAHDELVTLMVNGPARDAPEYAKLAGAIEGLEGLETLLRDLRTAAERGEAKLRAEAEASRPRLEAV